MRQETLDKYKRVRAAIEGGALVAEALADERMSTQVYYKIKNGGKPPRKYTRRAEAQEQKPKPDRAEYVDLTPAPSAQKVAVIVCESHQVLSILEQLK